MSWRFSILLLALLPVFGSGGGSVALAQLSTGAAGINSPACIKLMQMPAWARSASSLAECGIPDERDSPLTPVGPGSHSSTAAHPIVSDICPDRSTPTIQAAGGPGCNAWPVELLSNFAFGLHANAEGIAVSDTLSVFLAPGAASAASPGGTAEKGFLAPFMIAAYRCYATDALGVPTDLGPASDFRTARRTMTLEELMRSNCLPVPGRWQYRASRHPSLLRVTNTTLSLFAQIAHELSNLEQDRVRLTGIFGDRPLREQPRRDQLESEALRPINRPLQLSRLALRLAEASRPFLKTAEAMLKPGRDGALSAAARSWITALDTLFPAASELASLSLDDRVDLIASILASPSPIAGH